MSAPFSDAMLAERDALLTLAPLGLLLWFVVLAGIVWLLAVGAPFAVRVAWQLGVDPRRRLHLASSFTRMLAPLVALFGAMVPFWSRAPTVSLIGVVVVVVVVVAVSPSSARNLAAGVTLALRTRPRPGDQVRIGEIAGTVAHISLTRVSVRTGEGGVTLVPAADFERLPVTIGTHGAAVPIEVDVKSPVPLDDAALQRLRRALWFSPFRRAGTEIRVVCDPVGEGVHVVMDTWAPRASVELERHVGDLLRRNLALPCPPVAASTHGPDAAGEEVGP